MLKGQSKSQPKWSDEQIIEGLRATRGMVYLAAQKIGCDPETLRLRLKAQPELQQIVRDELEKMKDVVEIKFMEAIAKGDSWALKFFAGTKMRDRGYGDKTEIELHGSLEIPFLKPRQDLEPSRDD